MGLSPAEVSKDLKKKKKKKKKCLVAKVQQKEFHRFYTLVQT